MSQTNVQINAKGQFFLVSAGIGDADNMTLRAVNTIKQADVLIAMSFVVEQIKEYVPENARILDAGHGLFTELARHDNNSEEEILALENEYRLLIRAAVEQGLNVVLVEFGDPLMFGPQVGYLKEFSDLEPVIIPGISSFNAANGVIGQSVLGKGVNTLMLTSIKVLDQMHTPPSDVLVLFTMRLNLNQLIDKLLNIYPADTQLSIVLHAGFKDKQQVISTTLEMSKSLINEENIPWECLIYVGNISR
ncbi:tetrapyrrole methylase [Vibrio sp. HA2012]|uniref:SAM-dependent methyltransferase n=1 Tax=Vibrio sp. HA2012 TaxID=1971595 RepID=UPI000C2C7EF3|nr:SAM-dependent methyltransferase [Vibrio sp. HA2012]PJC86684.1 tetrapyrrole methylase [Vibrio sp. HA2012]